MGRPEDISGEEALDKREWKCLIRYGKSKRRISLKHHLNDPTHVQPLSVKRSTRAEGKYIWKRVIVL